MGVCCPFLQPWDQSRNRFLINFPCFSDPVRRSSLFLKLTLVSLHIIFIAFLLLLDTQFIEKTKRDPWYIGSYFFLFSATLLQYFVTSGSSPGYVVDAMRDFCETNAMFRNASTASIQHASRQNGSLIVTVEGGGSVSSAKRTTTTTLSSWGRLVLDLYPPGTSIRQLICSDCHVEQPPRSKHCHDCDRCVLQFDHHCVWLGTCIGQKNHSKFWLYICFETTLCLWTIIMYIDYLSNMTKPWWKNAIIILLLVILSIAFIFVLLLLIFHSYLILTNQSTYELVRRRRIPYMRNFPERVHPFSRGIKRNVYNVCCGNYNLDSLPTAYELEDKLRPYTCLDMLKCRCC